MRGAVGEHVSSTIRFLLFSLFSQGSRSVFCSWTELDSSSAVAVSSRADFWDVGTRG